MRQPAPRVDGFRHKAYFRFCIKHISDASQNTSRMPSNSVNRCRTIFCRKYTPRAKRLDRQAAGAVSLHYSDGVFSLKYAQ